MENILNVYGPCLDKSCGHCCDPVRIDIKNIGKLPTDKNGKEIFVQRDEILAPESLIETVRLKTFDCKNFDPVTKQCSDHENRPDLCRNSSCITDPEWDIDGQYKKATSEKFIKIHRK